MNKMITLTKYYGKSLFREQTLLIIIFLFPIILITVAAFSAPEGSIPITLDGELIEPFPDADEVSVLLYSSTAVVFVVSIVSFFTGFQLKTVYPRLKISGYSSLEVGSALVFLILFINTLVTIIVTLFTLNWVTPEDITGYVVSLFISGIIFSLLGLIIADIVDTKALGLNAILTVAIIDTGFLENPIYSRRYDESWMDIMPAHRPVQSLFRATYDTGVSWTNDLSFMILYIIGILLVYAIIIKLFRK